MLIELSSGLLTSKPLVKLFKARTDYQGQWRVWQPHHRESARSSCNTEPEENVKNSGQILGYLEKRLWRLGLKTKKEEGCLFSHLPNNSTGHLTTFTYCSGLQRHTSGERKCRSVDFGSLKKASLKIETNLEVDSAALEGVEFCLWNCAETIEQIQSAGLGNFSGGVYGAEDHRPLSDSRAHAEPHKGPQCGVQNSGFLAPVVIPLFT